jgi:hypothetical protein
MVLASTLDLGKDNDKPVVVVVVVAVVVGGGGGWCSSMNCELLEALKGSLGTPLGLEVEDTPNTNTSAHHRQSAYYGLPTLARAS